MHTHRNGTNTAPNGLFYCNAFAGSIFCHNPHSTDNRLNGWYAFLLAAAPVRSFLSLLNAVPKFLRDDRLVGVIKHILLIFIGSLSLMQFEIGADRLYAKQYAQDIPVCLKSF